MAIISKVTAETAIATPAAILWILLIFFPLVTFP